MELDLSDLLVCQLEELAGWTRCFPAVRPADPQAALQSDSSAQSFQFQTLAAA